MSFDLKISDGDLVISSSGDLEKVEGLDKLIQDILKILTTPIGTNRFHPWYGSPVSKSMVGSAFDLDFISTMASSQARSSLENLQKLQKAQMAFQKVSPDEQLAAIRYVKIDRNIVDPRFFSILVSVLTSSLKEAKTGFELKPGL